MRAIDDIIYMWLKQYGLVRLMHLKNETMFIDKSISKNDAPYWIILMHCSVVRHFTMVHRFEMDIYINLLINIAGPAK